LGSTPTRRSKGGIHPTDPVLTQCGFRVRSSVEGRELKGKGERRDNWLSHLPFATLSSMFPTHQRLLASFGTRGLAWTSPQGRGATGKRCECFPVAPGREPDRCRGGRSSRIHLRRTGRYTTSRVLLGQARKSTENMAVQAGLSRYSSISSSISLSQQFRVVDPHGKVGAVGTAELHQEEERFVEHQPFGLWRC
jgi:hypothetical protein